MVFSKISKNILFFLFFNNTFDCSVIDGMPKLTADDLIYGYMNGIFPMSDDGALYWYSPDPRAIIPIDTYKPPKSLRPVINAAKFEIRINTNFEEVMYGCADIRTDTNTTWISDEIISAYTDLHYLGLAHSVEAYLENKLVGGLYGVCIGAAFFGESMFYSVSNASKVAFHYLIQLLKAQNFELLDTQFMNDNVLRYGAIEIPKAEYFRRLKSAVGHENRFIKSGVAHFFEKKLYDQFNYK